MPGTNELAFGIHVNNREPLLAAGYGIPELLALAELADERGFDSIWVGDSLFSKPRYEPIALLSAISQRTQRARLGTSCLIASTRNPLYLALEWATLDVLSGGRTIFGAGASDPGAGVRREFAALGLDFDRRFEIFEETLAVLREVWTRGTVTWHGEFFNYDEVSFHSGTELAPLMPVQKPPPFWVVSNPRIISAVSDQRAIETMKKACRRILKYGDGWMSCCRAAHPEELIEQLGYLRQVAAETGDDADRLTISYQVIMTLGDTTERARATQADHIARYYPELNKITNLDDWGPVGTPDQVAAWFRTFAAAGVRHFICRFGAVDQFDQLERFTRDVLPTLRG